MNHPSTILTVWRNYLKKIKMLKSSAEKLGSDTILMILNDFLETFKVRFRGLNNIPFLMNGQTSCYHTLKWFYRVIEHKCRKKLFRILKDALSNISSRSIAIFTFRWLLPMGLLLINGPEIALAADAKQNFQFWHIRMIKIPTNNTLGWWVRKCVKNNQFHQNCH